MTNGSQPSILKMHAFYTKCFVAVPKSKRDALAAKGLHNYRAEPARFLGFQSLLSTTYAAMLDQVAHSMGRLVHSSNVTFDDLDTRVVQPAVAAEGDDPQLVCLKEAPCCLKEAR